MAIVSKKEMEDELNKMDDQIGQSFGRRSLSVTGKKEMKSIFTESLKKPIHEDAIDVVIKEKMKRGKSKPKVILSDKDLAEFKEWEDEIKTISGWEDGTI